MPVSHPDLANVVRQPGGTTRRIIRTAWLLPGSIALGFALLFAALFRDRLIPAPTVTVSPALAIASSTTTPAPDEHPANQTPPQTSASNRQLFQASGWIEPDPLPVKLSSLTDGFIDEVHVLDGAKVKKGELVATLIDTDARLARDAAAPAVAKQEARLGGGVSNRSAARHKQAAERAGLEAAEADASEAADKLGRLERATSGAVPEAERISAQLEHSRRQAGLRLRQAMIDQTSEELKALAHEAAAVRARIAGARAALAQAELNLARTRIESPIDGRVLRLVAVPGQKKMVAGDDPDSSTIAILYDPAKLQARVDVPLADAAGLVIGGAVEVRCNLLPDLPFRGTVTRIGGEADLQRNTLQAKVALENPGDLLRPEMLCRAAFFATPAAPARDGAPAAVPMAPAGGGLAVFVPEDAIRESAVWVCDPETGRVARRAVMAAAEQRKDYRRLESGLLPGELVVRNPTGLSEGMRVRPNRVP